MNENKDIKRIHAASADIISGAQPTIEKQWAFANDTKRIIVHEVGGAYTQFPNSTEVILKDGSVAFTGDQSQGGYGITGIRDAAFLDTDTLTIDHDTGLWSFTSSVAEKFIATSFIFKDSDLGGMDMIFHKPLANTWEITSDSTDYFNLKFITIALKSLQFTTGDLTFSKTADTNWNISTGTLASQTFIATSFIFEDSNNATGDLTFSKPSEYAWSIETSSLVTLNIIGSGISFKDHRSPDVLAFSSPVANLWEISAPGDIRLAGTSVYFSDYSFSGNSLTFNCASIDEWTIDANGDALRLLADDIVFKDTDQAALLTLANNSNTEWSFTTSIAEKFIATSFIFEDSDYATGNLIFNKTVADIWAISTGTQSFLKFIARSFIFEDSEFASGDLEVFKLDADTWRIQAEDATLDLMISAAAIIFEDRDFATGNLLFNKTASDTWQISTDTTTQKLTLAMNNIRISPTVYDDWRWSGTPVNPPGGATPATLAQIGATGAYAYFFDNGDVMCFPDQQIPHNYKEGTAIVPHIHWVPSTTATYTGTWTLVIVDWVSVATGTAKSATTTVTAAFNSAMTADQVQSIDFSANLSGTGRKISSCATFTLSLALTAGTSCYLLGLDGHYEVDSLGSTQITAKD